MRTVIRRAADWFVSTPPESSRRMSLWATLAAAAMILIDTAQLFVLVVGGEVVRVPYFAGIGLSPRTGYAALLVWSVGLVAFVHPWSRSRLGWLAPLGVVAAAFLDRQTYASSVMYLVTLSLTMHWWSSLLEKRTETSHLHGVPLRVIQTQVSIVFLWTAFAKLNPRFLSGALLSVSFHGPVAPPEFLLERGALQWLALLTVVAEGLIALALWIDTLRKAALWGVAVFHALIVMFFAPTIPLIAFGLAMASGYTLFSGQPWASTR